jgi:putative Mg2+ transporter-C (MgtC) family protein
MELASWGEPTGQGWAQIGDLALAFALSAAIGLEQEIRHRSAGLRTHTLVGFAAALIVLVSKYGFTDVLSAHVTLDPSRVAAQIVSGIGFIGAGLIFVRRDAVRGLTTAAAIWLTAAVGMAAGAGLPVLALVVTAGHFLVVVCFTPFESRIPTSTRVPGRLRVDYADGPVTAQDLLAQCAGLQFGVVDLSTDRHEGEQDSAHPLIVTAHLTVQGKRPITELVAALSDIDGVRSVSTLHRHT